MLAPQTKRAGTSEVEIHIKFMGDLPAVMGSRSLKLRMPAESTVRSLLTKRDARDAFFENGEVEVVMLPMFGGE